MGRNDQEFLFHLYRGSELLQENAVDEAKAELERALGLQPRDTEGQALLGIVYFRLGMYPRAIEIYEKLARSNPTEVTPRINLALCYLKTGQAESARDHLEFVVSEDPSHQRAWGYLGLVYQRFGDLEKARVAFERSGRPKLAERMAALQNPALDGASPEIPEIGRESGGSIPPPPPSLRPSLMPPSLRPPALPRVQMPVASEGTEPSLRVTAVDSRMPTQLVLPQPAQRFSRQSELVFPEDPRFALHEQGFLLARVDGSLALRPQWLSALSCDRTPFTSQPLRRRTAGDEQPELLGGASPLVNLIGSGRVVLTPRAQTRLFLVTVSRDEHLYVKESHLVCFEPQVEYETGQLDAHGRSPAIVVKLWGKGTVAAFSRGPVHSLPVTRDAPLVVRADRVVGWLGRLLPRSLPPDQAPSGLHASVAFSGQGSVFLEIG
ncbi:MAG: hypothetical protein RJA70_2286 [Pseudomonadota bacterium]|jgi:hypothetical protein